MTDRSYASDKTVESFWVKLYVSGPIEVAKQVLREECSREGLCVTIDPALFIYTGGEEAGFAVGLLNYPRFPTTPCALKARALLLADRLISATHQHSCLLQDPVETRWVSVRSAS